jgi:hypothetical protein
MHARDTSPAAGAVHLELYRQIGAARRAQIAADLSDAVRATAIAGIRRRHPDYSDRDVAGLFIKIVYGIELKK